MKFVAIDVETANSDVASICQIGVARFESGVLKNEWKTYIDPEDYFDEINVSIHDIDETVVKGAPKFKDIGDYLIKLINKEITVIHTHFDRISLTRATRNHNCGELDCLWLDSARVARRTWEECAYKGYGLSHVCKLIGYKFNHHDALEDAKASAHILLAAIEKTGFSLNDWIQRVENPIGLNRISPSQIIQRAGNSNGPLFGEVIVFTGALTIPRGEAADIASDLGCEVDESVTKKTTLVVVGDQDVARLAGFTKSAKHRRAEELIKTGQSLRILRESDFRFLVQQSFDK